MTTTRTTSTATATATGAMAGRDAARIGERLDLAGRLAALRELIGKLHRAVTAHQRDEGS